MNDAISSLPTGNQSHSQVVFCRGHGTQVRGDRLVATVCGVIDRVNKLITVRTLHRRYGAEVGDVVIGRVTEVCVCIVLK